MIDLSTASKRRRFVTLWTLFWIGTSIVVWLIWRDGEPITDPQTARLLPITLMTAAGATYFLARWKAKKPSPGIITDGRFTAAMFYGLNPLVLGVAASLICGISWSLWVGIGLSLAGTIWPFSILKMEVPYDPDM